MIFVVIGLLAVIAAEAAGALVLAARRTGDAAGGRARAGESPGGEELEKRWQEGMSSMLTYDLMAARRAVRSDGEDER